MTKTQLIDKLKEKFSIVLQEEEGAMEGNIKHWQIPVIDKVGDVMQRQWVHFYTQGTEAYWQNSEPKPEVVAPSLGLAERVNSFIITKISDGTIKFASIKEINEKAKKVLVETIKQDKTKVQAIISEDAMGDFSIELL